MITENYTIEPNDIEIAQDFCKRISDGDIRSRAVANSFAANIAENFFDKDKYNVDTTSGLHNIDYVLKDIDISDIYINNNYIDVRICYQTSELTIPQKHFNMGITPFAYMFIELTVDLSQASVLGFILTEAIDKTRLNETDIVISRNDLVTFDSIAYLMNAPESAKVEAAEIYNFIDGQIFDKTPFYQKLILSKEARVQLARAVKAQYIFNGKTEFSNYVSEQIEYKYPTEVESNENYQEFELTEEALNNSDLQSDYSMQDISSQNISTKAEEEETIDTLFNKTEHSDADNSSDFDNSGYDENFRPPKKKSNVVLLTLVAVLLFAGAGAYYFFNQQNLPSNNNVINDDLNNNIALSDKLSEKKADVMPIETVEQNVLPQNTNEGNAISLPSIEKNLDASILVSNLKIEWEVPQSYVSGISTKKYFEKLGKIIQLNLKTELLLLSKPPITNKIAVELKYNKADKKFETVGIAVSSGEKHVDELILQTVNSALTKKLNINTDSFANTQDSLLLIIRL